MSISQAEIKRRYTAIREWMKKHEAGCLLVAGKADNFNRGNVRYLTTLGNGGYCLFPLEGTPCVDSRPESGILKPPGITGRN